MRETQHCLFTVIAFSTPILQMWELYLKLAQGLRTSKWQSWVSLPKNPQYSCYSLILDSEMREEKKINGMNIDIKGKEWAILLKHI